MRLAVMTAVLALVAAAPAGARPQAPGAPGKKPTWAPADKHGFGTSTTRASRVWFTLRAADLSEVYYPTLGTPSVRGLEFAVSGRSFVERESRSATTSVTQSDPESLTYTQVTTSRRGRWRLTKTYVTDPA